MFLDPFVVIPVRIISPDLAMSTNDADVEHKIGIARQKKDTGDEAFKKGDVTNGTENHPVSGRLQFV